LSITKELRNGSLIVTPEMSTLDVKSSREFKDLVDSLDLPEKLIVLNLAHVEFVDSTGLGVIFLLCKKATESDVNVHAAAVMDQVMAVFRLVQMPKVLDIFDTVDEALEAE